MKRSEPHPSLDGTLRRLLWSMLLLVCVILVATLAILLLHNQQYSLVTANIVRASQFNQNFKEEVLKNLSTTSLPAPLTFISKRLSWR